MTRKRFKLPKNISKKKLKREIVVISVVFVAILSVTFVPWFLSLPAVPPTEQLYKDYSHLFSIVERYDYEKGASPELEDRINRSLEHNSSPTQYYYNLKAKIEYYYRLGKYDVIKDDLKTAHDFAPNELEIEYLDNIGNDITLSN